MEYITGLMIYYYFVCHKKLWYFLNEIQLEKEKEDIKLGKILDQTSFDMYDKNIIINNEISLDFKDKNTIHEIKKSKSIEEAGIWQTKYYLYYLKKRGVNNLKAEIDYPLLKEKTIISLTEDDEQKLNEIIEKINLLKQCKMIPEKINKKRICKSCAYYEFCYI